MLGETEVIAHLAKGQKFQSIFVMVGCHGDFDPNEQGFIHWNELLAMAQTTEITEPCECVDVMSCVGLTTVYTCPDDVGIPVPDNVNLFFSDKVTYSTTNTTTMSATMTIGDSMTFVMDEAMCLSTLRYSIRASAGGSGEPRFNIYVDDTLTHASAPIYSVAGNIENNKSCNIVSTGGSYFGSTIRCVLVGTGVTRSVQIFNIRARGFVDV